MTRNVVADGTGVQMHTSGAVDPTEARYAQKKVAGLAPLAPAPVLAAHLAVICHPDPAMDRPAEMKASIDVNGRVVRAHVAAPTLHEAADALEDRLRGSLERLAHRADDTRRRHAKGEWHHGDERTLRPGYFPRPDDEREVVTHKSYAIGDCTAEEAADELELLDHDFFLFHDIETDADEVIARHPGNGYTLYSSSPLLPVRVSAPTIEPSEVRPTTMALDDAIALLDATDAPFVFFFDAATERGQVVYRRYDGHYGVIEPADL
ncbi:MAG: ribosome hibernation promotion factor [Acidimicrobiia bacterium]